MPENVSAVQDHKAGVVQSWFKGEYSSDSTQFLTIVWFDLLEYYTIQLWSGKRNNCDWYNPKDMEDECWPTLDEKAGNSVNTNWNENTKPVKEWNNENICTNDENANTSEIHVIMTTYWDQF